jgi:hypothetical protein
MATAVLIIWSSVEHRELMAPDRAEIINEMVMANKTDGLHEQITPTTFRRVFTDESHANEFIEKLTAFCAQNGVTAPTFIKK